MPASKGQSTVEYILLVSAVILVIVLFTANNGTFQQRLNNVLTTATQDMINEATHLQDNAASGS